MAAIERIASPLPDPPALAVTGGAAEEKMFFVLERAEMLGDMPAEPEPFLEDPPFPPEFDPVPPLDPARAAAPDEPPPAARPLLPVGLIGSLGMHLLPLAFLVSWGAAPAATPPPIPVRLVLEKPKPVPSVGKKRPPPGRLASVSMGQKVATPGKASTPAKPAAAKAPAPKPRAAAPVVAKPTPPPAEPRVAAIRPPPEKPALPARPEAAAPPKPERHRPPPLPKLAAIRPPHRAAPTAHEAPHAGTVPGPAATRDQYLAYLVNLTRRQFYMLPLNFIAGRSGETVLSIRVLGDGTIAQIAVAQGSGYPDIDSRIEKMVASIHRFPPLPQWYQGNSMDLDMRLRYPQALEQ